MTGFLLKKTFFDLCDNALRLALLNAGLLVSAAFFMIVRRLLALFFPLSAAVSGGVFFLGAIWCFVYLSAVSLCVKNISDYGTFGFNDFLRALRSAWTGGAAYGVYFCAAAAAVIFTIPFYLLLGNTAGLFAASAVFWTVVASGIILQYFFAVRARLGAKNIKAVKKCVLLFIDNPLFFIGTMLLSVLFFAASVVSAFLIPGPAGILLFADEALRLRLLKYDWLEQNGGESARCVPWDTILAGEREKTGSRTMRGIFFPWKD
ncbi:MAG: hypothetical protein LBJ86_05350 [Spirochaetaceae bacterium]|jgi:hypothetical protein|nr:hypothetical protein [Spirochaetaceae bacterium]